MSMLLNGGLGARKDSPARGLLRGLGLEGPRQSTFAILQGYVQPPDVAFPVGHVDLNRLEDPRELEELGLDDSAGDGASSSNGRTG